VRRLWRVRLLLVMGVLPHLLAHWTSQIIAGPDVELDSCAVLAGDDPDGRA
jgi:hypothetical protein